MERAWCRVLLLVLPLLLLPVAAWATDESQPGSTEALPLTLAECYGLALKRSETIAIQAELVRQTEGRFIQALSTALPDVAFESSEKRQDGGGGSAFTLKQVPERKFTFSQPLFAGFKEFSAMRGSRAERRERLQQKARAEQLLFVDVADAFYLFLEHQQDAQILTAVRDALQARIDELTERERLGRSRASEVVSAQAQLRRVDAQVEGVRSDAVVSRQLLEFLTGASPITAVSEVGFAVPALEAEAVYLAKSSARPDVRAAEEAWRVFREAVRIAQATFLPTVDLEGNYYTKRVGVSQSVDWDALLTVRVPLFQGGEAFGATKEASSKARQAKLQFDQTARSASLEIQHVYARLQAALARQAALEQALAASEEDYRLQVEDYRRSLVNNLDVLRTLQTLQDARRDALHAQYETKRLYWQLRVATGEVL